MNLLKHSWLLFFYLCAQGETVAQKKVAETLRLVPLEKITVGADDNYQAIVSGSTMIYVEKVNFAPHLVVHNLAISEKKNFVDAKTDSDQPSLDLSGDRVAYRSFQKNARGEICIQALKSESATCPELPVGERLYPFWVNDDKLGFVLKDLQSQKSGLYIYDLSTKKSELIVSGDVSSPSASSDGRTLAFVEISKVNGRLTPGLVIYDIARKLRQPLALDMPGVSAFPIFSKNGDFLYFTQYLSDSNNDQVIDAADNSVVLRLSLPLKGTGTITAQPLTSLEQNCSFPFPGAQNLYVTCDFEGSLDIYRLPLTGLLPPSWNPAMVWQAHETARTFEERIFLLQSLQFVTPNKNVALLSKLFSNHLFRDDMISAQTYWDDFSKATPTPPDLDFGVRLYTRARKRAQIQAGQEITPAFSKAVDQDLKAVQDKLKPSSLRDALTAHLALDVGSQQRLKSSLQKLETQTPKAGFDAHLMYLLLMRAPSTEAQAEKILSRILSSQAASREAKISYLYHFLMLDDKKKPQDRMARVERLSGMLKDEDLQKLLQGERLTLQLLQATDEAQKKKVYGEFDQLFSKNRENYSLRRALAMQAILNLAAANDFKYMQFVASQFFNYTEKNGTELYYAREFFVTTVLDRAYAAMLEKKWLIAQGHFFGSMVLTDDLESHAGFIKTKLLNGQQKELQKDYEEFKRRQITSENMPFVEAMVQLLTSPDVQVKNLDEAIEKLETMKNQTQGIYYLVLGYCYLEKLAQSAGAAGDLDLKVSNEAHRNLSLAFDLSRDNQRVRASSLDSLAVLHTWLQNWGLAARFLDLRKSINDTDIPEGLALRWMKARALYHINDFKTATFHLEEGLSKPFSAAGVERLAFLERRAFYELNSQKYQTAAASYDEFWKEAKGLTSENSAKIHLSTGFANLKAGQIEKAKSHFTQSLALSEKMAEGTTKDSLKRPGLRVRLHALGFLAQIESGEARVKYLTQRRDLLRELKSQLNETRMKPEMRWMALAKTDLQLAELTTDKKAKTEHLKDVVESLDELGDQLTTTFTADHLRGLYGVFIMLRKDAAGQDEVLSVAQKLYERIQKDGDKIKQKSIPIENEFLRLQLAYEGLKSNPQGAANTLSLLQSPPALRLKTEAPTMFAELEALQKTLF